MIKIVIADDIPILRQGLEAVLQQDGELMVVGCASDGREAFELCGQLHPDVVLMDMRMPQFDGQYGTQKIKESFPEIKVLVLTTFDDEETVKKAVSSGADGYILKEMDNSQIINSVKAVSGGVNVFCANIFSSIKQNIAEKPTPPPDKPLTERERELMTLIAEGCDNKEIAARLFLAEGTVRNNISRLLEKLSLKDRTQLAVYAVKHDLF
ncbi:MAG: response regulator [Oscillospiraceae bacterium]